MDATTRGHRAQIFWGIFLTFLLLTLVHLPTMAQSGCFPHDTAYVVGNMNIRQGATTDSSVVATAGAGASFAVSGSRQGEIWCWLNVGSGWMAKTSRVSSADPSVSATSLTQANIDNCCFIGWQCTADEEWTSGYWAFQNDQCVSPAQRQRQGNPYPVRVIRNPYTGVSANLYEDNSIDINVLIRTRQDYCEAHEFLGLPLPPECEDV